MNQSQYRKRWLRRHARYERLAYKTIISELRKQANNIPFILLTEDNYKGTIERAISQQSFVQSYYNIYDQIGQKEGLWMGKFINREIKQGTKDFTFNKFLSEWSRRLLEFLLNESSVRITSVRRTFIKYIQEVLAQGIADGKDISEIATDLQRLIQRRNFYRWQALTIARTETTTAANFASIVSADVSGVVSDKMWISARDARTRRKPKNKFDHFNMNGVKVGVNEDFIVSGEKMRFPGDPKGSEGNVINCRCSSAIVPRRDANGRIMRIR